MVFVEETSIEEISVDESGREVSLEDEGREVVAWLENTEDVLDVSDELQLAVFESLDMVVVVSDWNVGSLEIVTITLLVKATVFESLKVAVVDRLALSVATVGAISVVTTLVASVVVTVLTIGTYVELDAGLSTVVVMEESSLVVVPSGVVPGSVDVLVSVG
jgi:hypothetical protein